MLRVEKLRVEEQEVLRVEKLLRVEEQGEVLRLEELRQEEQEELLRVVVEEEEYLGRAVELFDAAGFVAMLRVVSSPQVPKNAKLNLI